MLVLTPGVNMMLRYAAEFNPKLEVAGFGRTMIAENGEDVIVTDIYIPPQIVKTAHADIKGPGEEGGGGMLENAIQHFATTCRHCDVAMAAHGGDHNFEGMSWADWRLWWHSHGQIAASPSGTDDQSLRTLAKYLDGWAAGLVINAAGDRHAWAAVRQGPFNLLLQKLDVGYMREHNQDLQDRIATMMEGVEEWKYQASPTQGQRQGGTTGTHPNGGGTNSPAVRRLPATTEGGKRLVDMSKEEFGKWLRDEVMETAK